MSFPRYPAYKDSRIEQLGDIPEHWEAVHVKRCLKSITQGWSPQCENFPADSGQWGVLKVGCVNGGSFDPSENKALPSTLEPIPELSIRQGDVLVSRANTRELVGSVAVAERDYQRLMLCDKLYRLRVDEQRCDAAFLASSLSTPAARGVIEATASGASSSMLNIGQAAITGMFIAVPPLKEQQALVAFIQSEAAKIDALAEDQRRLIELLKEKRQAVISQAVTKGLNVGVSMKDSGVAWLGEVPAHWGHAKKLADLAANERHSFVNGPFGSDLLTGELTEKGVPVVYIRDIKPNGYQRVSEWHVTADKARQLAFCNVVSGDIIIAKVGDPPGLAAIYPDEEPDGIVTQDVIRLRLDRSKAAPSYIRWLLNSRYGQTMIDDISVESTRTRVGLGEYKQLRFFVPPLQEQEELAQHIERFVAGLDSLVTEASLAATLLQERRSALISAAVTGKIDVRGLVPQPGAVAA
jgi:type I restriction enzyme, S subunit